MASELRIVVDTGVAISAVLLPHSVPRLAVDAALSLGRLLVSDATASNSTTSFGDQSSTNTCDRKHGDPDLVALHSFRGIEMVSPAAFLALLKDDGASSA